MRSIGVAERAIEAMCARAEARVEFGMPLAEQGVIRDWIAEARVRVEQLRLLVLKAAWLMDIRGNKAAHSEIQAIKIATPGHRGVDPGQGNRSPPRAGSTPVSSRR